MGICHVCGVQCSFIPSQRLEKLHIQELEYLKHYALIVLSPLQGVDAKTIKLLTARMGLQVGLLIYSYTKTLVYFVFIVIIL